MNPYILRWIAGFWLCAVVGAEAGEPLDEKDAPLYLIRESGGWGLIDAGGKIVLEPRFEQVAGRPRQIGSQGSDRARVVVEEIERAEPVLDRLIPVRLDGKAGFASRDGKLLELGSYDLIAPNSSGGRFSVSKGGRFGYADTTGKIVIPLNYEDARPFQHGYAFVKRSGRWGIVDPNGKSVVEPTWDEVAEVHEWSADYEWRAVRSAKRWGVVDRGGREILPLRFDAITNPSPPLVAAVSQGRHVYVRPGGDIAFEVPCPASRPGKEFDARGFPFFGRQTAMFKCGSKWGLVDSSGQVVLAPEWDSISQFDQGLAVAMRKSKKALVDARGSIRLPLGRYDLHGPYGSVVAFAEKSTGGLFSGLTNAAESGPFGLLDAQGQVVLPPQLDWIGGCEGGLCLVCKQNKVGFLDVTGKWLFEPKLQFAGPFRGPLALATRGVDSTAELTYIDRKGATVYTMRIKGVRIRGQCGLKFVSVD